MPSYGARGYVSLYADTQLCRTAAPFVGNEAAFTYIDAQPHGASVGGPFGGVLPIGNVHPNAQGYAAIAAHVSAVPEPAAWALMAAGLAFVGMAGGRRAALGVNHDGSAPALPLTWTFRPPRLETHP